MKVSGWIGGVLLISSCVLTGSAQSLVLAGTNAARGAQAVASVPERIFREIRDPRTGTHWIVLRSAENPAGPGRAVAAPDAGAKEDQAAAATIVIRAGDKVVLEERTPAVEASLEAVALGAATIGSRLDVRLKIGGKVVRAVALAPGRAALVPSGEARP